MESEHYTEFPTGNKMKSFSVDTIYSDAIIEKKRLEAEMSSSNYKAIQGPDVDPVEGEDGNEGKPEGVVSSCCEYKNLLVLALSFTFAWTSYVSLQSLQSTVNHAEGLGVLSLSCVYGATVISCFLSPLVIAKLTTKGVISGAFVLLSFYVTSNFYPASYLLLPSAILLGLLSGPLWSSQATHLANLAIRHSVRNQVALDRVLRRFNGVFDGFLQMSQVVGHIITTVALSDSHVVEANKVNETNPLYPCGSSDCGVHNYVQDTKPAQDLIRVPLRVRGALFGVHIGCVVMAIVMVTVLLDKGESHDGDEKETVTPSLSTCGLLSATLRSLQDPRLQLLIPLVVFTGLTKGFILGDFTKSYVTCALGVHTIGPVMACFGAVNAITSFATVYVVQHLKRLPVMGSAAAFQLGLLLVLYLWRPRGDDIPMFYVVASCLGLCDAIWTTQTNSLFGLLFAESKEAAFANFRMFQAVGYATAFGYSYYLCVATKVYIMGALLLVGFVLYGAVEYKLKQAPANERDGTIL